MIKVIKYLLLLYRKTNIYGANCRYYPSCSYYAEEAIEKHGIMGGTYLALKRLIRCSQLFKGGFDPVPERIK